MTAGIALSFAELLVLDDKLDEAAEEVALGFGWATNVPVYRGGLLGVSSMIKLRRNDIEGALEDSAQAMAYAARAVTLRGAYSQCLARYEALRAAHLEDEARAVLRDGVATLAKRAAKLAEYGPMYIERGWRTAELMRLAREQGLVSK